MAIKYDGLIGTPGLVLRYMRYTLKSVAVLAVHVNINVFPVPGFVTTRFSTCSGGTVSCGFPLFSIEGVPKLGTSSNAMIR